MSTEDSAGKIDQVLRKAENIPRQASDAWHDWLWSSWIIDL